MNDFADVEAVLWDYLEGLYEGDVERLGRVFLPESNLYAVRDGALATLPRDAWLEAVRSRRSAKDSGHPSTNQVLWIDVAGSTAVARVRCSFPPNGFTDTLSLLKTAAGWRIVAKTYHVSPV